MRMRVNLGIINSGNSNFLINFFETLLSYALSQQKNLQNQIQSLGKNLQGLQILQKRV
jgi:hypothetical protein